MRSPLVLLPNPTLALKKFIILDPKIRKKAGMEVEGMTLSRTNLKNLSCGPNGTSFSPWKLYDNPHYLLHCRNNSPQEHRSQSCSLPQHSGIVAAGFGLMEHGDIASQLELAKVHVKELKAELEFERRMRRKAESLNEVLAMELAEERKRREDVEAECKRIQEEEESRRAEVEQAMEEIEEERRMLRVVELWREERVQMKLAEAKMVMEAKLQEMSEPNGIDETHEKGEESSSRCTKSGSTGKSIPSSQNGQQSPRGQHGQHRREAENPHIRRGIKGFVEFPKAIRVRSREERVDLESNLECQRAQLRVLFRNRNPAGLGLIGTSENLVM